ncbi:MAG: 50S ribosomal protein L9 [Pyrinomonadaceae bacterium]
MATTTILLREDIDTLGGRGEIVKVKAGYARNYLLPKGLATLATKGNIKQIEQERAVLLKKAAEEKSTAELQAEQMKDIVLDFERKAGETGTLFGSVTSMDITEAINAKGYEIDRRKVVLKDPIKELGDFTVGVKLHREVTLQIPVTVRAEGELITEEKAEEPAEEEAAAETEVKAEATEEAAEATAETDEEPAAETAAEDEEE